jgi:hypothetical protein
MALLCFSAARGNHAAPGYLSLCDSFGSSGPSSTTNTTTRDPLIRTQTVTGRRSLSLPLNQPEMANYPATNPSELANKPADKSSVSRPGARPVGKPVTGSTLSHTHRAGAWASSCPARRRVSSRASQ